MKEGSITGRWAPGRFSDIVGQQQVVDALRGYVEKPALLPSTLLFSGPPGVGKTTTARVLARALNCDSFENDVCGECPSCVHGGPFLNTLIEVDGSVDRGIDAMREVRSWTNSASRASCSVILIDEAHALTPEAWNALLKSLEGGPGVVWVLATNYPDRLPEPVHSRSTHLEFVPATADDMRPALQHIRDTEALGTNDEQMEMAIESSQGAMRDALTALFALDAGLSISTTPDDIVRRAVILAEEGNIGASVRLLEQRVKATRDALQVFDEIVERVMEPLVNGLRNDISRRLLLSRLADHRVGVGRGMADQMAVRLLPNLIHLAYENVEGPSGLERESEPSGTAIRETTCPTLTAPHVGKSGRAYGAEPCGRATCEVCGIRKAEDLHAAICFTRPPIRVSLMLPPRTRATRDKRMERMLSAFGASVHCWYEREILTDGRIAIDCWMRPKDATCELTEAEFRAALNGLVQSGDVQWSSLQPSEDYEDFLSELRSSWALSPDETRVSLESWVARNGAQMIHGSHGFFLDEGGQPRHKKAARLAVSL